VDYLGEVVALEGHNEKLHKPMKFGEGLQPGTVEWERQKRQRRAAMEHWQRVERQNPPEPTHGALIARFFKMLFCIR
jgi:hypothetical protein